MKWTTKKFDDAQIVVLEKIPAGNLKLVATCTGNDRRRNADLIAAAPSLLEALRDVQQYFDVLDEMQPRRWHGKEAIRIREVVQDAIDIKGTKQ